MGASIYWRPKDFGTPVNVSLRSDFVHRMQTEFGNYPWHLRRANGEQLMGLYTETQEIGYYHLAEILQTNDRIEVWPEY